MECDFVVFMNFSKNMSSHWRNREPCASYVNAAYDKVNMLCKYYNSRSSNFIDMKRSIQTHMSDTLKDSKIVT